MVCPGHGERQGHGGERGDLPVERARQEELVEDHHGDGLAEDHTDSHHLQKVKQMLFLFRPLGGRRTLVKYNM